MEQKNYRRLNPVEVEVPVDAEVGRRLQEEIIFTSLVLVTGESYQGWELRQKVMISDIVSKSVLYNM